MKFSGKFNHVQNVFYEVVMIEIAMGICLTIMGIYFFKSTDLPKELKERSAQLKSETIQPAKLNKKMSFPTNIKINTPTIDQVRLSEINLIKKAAELKIHNDAIDKLTMTITALEQEIKVNNERNEEIQKMIDAHLITLQSLQEKINSLS